MTVAYVRRIAVALNTGVTVALLLAAAARGPVAAAAARTDVDRGSHAGAMPLRIIWSRDATWPRSVRALARRRALRLVDLKGHPFVLNFFASWCDACRGEARLLVAAARRHHGRVLFVGAAVNDGRRDARSFLRVHRVPFPAVVVDTRIVHAFRLIGLPDTFFVDRAGRVRMITTGALTANALSRGLSRLGS